MKCKINSWGCVYHACMSNDCQKHEVLQHHPGFGAGMCEKTTTSNMGIYITGGNSFPSFAKEGSVRGRAMAGVVLTSNQQQL